MSNNALVPLGYGRVFRHRRSGEIVVDTVMVVDEDVEFAMPSVLARRLRELSGQDAGSDAGSGSGSDEDASDGVPVDLAR